MNVRSSLLGDVLSTILFESIFPGLFYILYLNDIICLFTCKIGALISFVIFFMIPLIFKLSYTFQRQVIFLNYINIPKDAHYNAPEKYNLSGTRNLLLKSKDGVYLGTWHILPRSLIKDNLTDKDYEKLLSSGHPVFIYMHGNSGNRAADHRLDLYKLLREQYHVIAFDYRGYGDSTAIDPTETGAVTDAITVIHWVRNLTDSKIFVWGHSLGTGISTHALDILSQEKIQIDGLILECPFTNMMSEVGEHPSSYFFKNLPWFKFAVLDALYNGGFQFETDQHILRVDCSVLILHAEDDLVIPFHLGQRLYKIASQNRTKKQGAVHFKKFEGNLGFGHKYICKSPELPDIITKFVENSIKKAD